jgi:hypothetical protein
MKNPIIRSVMIALILSAGNVFSPVHAQPPTPSDTPTFYHLVPGTYVNGWPRFTINYPKDWVEVRPLPQEIFRAAAPRSVPYPFFVVALGPNPVPLEQFADYMVTMWGRAATDVTVVSNKPTRLKDGTPAREIEMQMILNGAPLYTRGVVTKQNDLMIVTSFGSRDGRVGEDLVTMLYAREFQPDKDVPVKVPPDVQQLLDKMNNDVVSHDVVAVMSHYSNSFLNSGTRKGEVERNFRQWIGSVTSLKATITDFVTEGDKAHLAGFVTINGATFPTMETSIVKENGEWRYYGNQRDVVP